MDVMMRQAVLLTFFILGSAFSQHGATSSQTAPHASTTGQTLSEQPAVYSSLPVAHEVARLLLQAEAEIAAGKPDFADTLLQRVAQLSEAPPVVYYFWRGQTQMEKNADRAQQLLQRYIIDGGATSQHYEEALRLLTRLQMNAEATAVPVVTLPSIQRPEAKRDALMALYLTDDETDAWMLHINALLAAHPFVGRRIIDNATQNKTIGKYYQLRLDRGDLLLTIAEGDGEARRLYSERISLAGLNPYLRYGCAASERACWLFHPSQQTQRWIWLDLNRDIAAELSDSMSTLLRLLQR